MSAFPDRVRLTRQLVVPLALMAVLLIGSAIGLGWWQMNRQLEAQLWQRSRTIVRIIGFSAGATDSREELSRLNHMLVTGGDVELTALVTPNQMRVLIASRGRLLGKSVAELPELEIAPAVVAAAREKREAAVFERSAGRFVYVGPLGVSRPLPLREAQVLVILNTGLLQEQIAGSLQVLLSALVAVGLAGLLGFGWLLRLRVIRPLSKLAAAFGQTKEGQELPEPARGEARELATLSTALRTAFGQVRELNRDLEQRVHDRTAELVASLDREREVGRLRTNFIGLVSHEYRNSLATILSSAQILERYRDRLPDGERARHLAQITASCRRLAVLVEDVLLYSRSESGRLEVSLGPVDLPALCREEAAEAARPFPGGADRLVFTGNAVGAAVSDAQLLHHILSNLLGNALKYSPADQPVDLHLRRDGEAAVLTVTDRGIGIPADELPQLGVAFRRGSNVGDVAGTGLGLVMVRRCLDLLDGRLLIECPKEGGTTATVSIPAFRNEPAGGTP